MCKAVDETMEISGVKLIEKKGGKSDYATGYRPKVGVVTLSDGVVRGKREDISGKILADGFLDSGCVVDHRMVLEDCSEKNLLVPNIEELTADVSIKPAETFILRAAFLTIPYALINSLGKTSFPILKLLRDRCVCAP